jgi:transposase-like protein
MKKSVKFSPEVRERSVRMVTECRGDHPSQWAAVESIAAKIGCTPQIFQIQIFGVSSNIPTSHRL